MFGKRNWFFPDAELPPPGEGVLQGHESIIVLNPNDADAVLTIRLYFEVGRQPEEFETFVAVCTVRCLRTNHPDDMGGCIVPRETQYAIAVHADQPVVAQYGRLDNRQANLAFYTSPGYCE